MNKEFLSETKVVEPIFCELLEQQGWKKKKLNQISNSEQLWDEETIKSCIKRINNNVNEQIIKLAYTELTRPREGNVTSNKEIIEMLQNGFVVSYYENNEKKFKRIHFIDWSEKQNIFEYANQIKINTIQNTKIPDIILFLNGIPISNIELKSPTAKEKLVDATLQLSHYSNLIAPLYNANLFAVVSNCFDTKYGSLFSSFSSHWWSWKKTNEDAEIEQDSDILIDVIGNNKHINCNLEKNIKGLFNQKIFLNILKSYTYFAKEDNVWIKYIPTYYQYFGIEKTIKKLQESNTNKIGFLWFTQGSGKSVMMVYLAKKINLLFQTKYKIVYITDRTDLDNQIYTRLYNARNYLCTNPINIKSRNELKDYLSKDKEFGIYTTTLQKFSEDTGLLSEKDNVLLVVDEAHRSHNNIDTEIQYDEKLQEIIEKKGFAGYLHEAFPNAKIIGFTGTPLLKGNKLTENIFGSSIDKYSMDQSVRDGSTVPIYYEKRRLPIVFKDCDMKKLDDLFEQLIHLDECENIKNSQKEFIKREITKYVNIFSNDKVIKNVVEDFWKHYLIRKNVLNGKALFVTFNRKIAFKVYQEMIRLHPEYKDQIIFVVTKSNKDTNKDMINAIPSDEQKLEYECEFKKVNSKYKIAVVVDMWLTGFDIKDLDTLYLFKISKCHNLLQTITRVNRTFTNSNGINKDSGLIVDYIGIWHYIANALKDYSGYSNIRKNVNEAYIDLKNINHKITKTFFIANSFSEMWLTNTDPKMKFKILMKASEYILQLDNEQINSFLNDTKSLSKIYKIVAQLSSDNFDNENDFNDYVKNKQIAYFYILIKNIIRSSKIEDNTSLLNVIETLNKSINEYLDVGEIEVSILNTNTTPKSITDVLEYIEQDKQKYNKNLIENKTIEKICLEQQMRTSIRELYQRDKVTADKLSERLKKVLETYEEDKNFEKFIKVLQELAKDIDSLQMKDNNDENAHLRQFYEIFSNPKYKDYIQNTEIVRDMVKDVWKIVENEINSSSENAWFDNEDFRNSVNSKIKGMLKKKYDFPPSKYTEDNDGNSASKRVMQEITYLLRNNKIKK